MAGNINIHSQVQNSHCHRRQNAAILEDLIEQFGLLINNEPKRATCSLNKEILVIELALSFVQLGPLTPWEISKKHLLLSDHQLIVLPWEDVDYNLVNQKCGGVIGQNIQSFIKDQNSL